MKVFSFIWSIVIKKLDFQNTSTQIQDHFLVKNVQMGVQNPYWCSVYFLNMCIRRFEMQYILYSVHTRTKCKLLRNKIMYTLLVKEITTIQYSFYEGKILK